MDDFIKKYPLLESIKVSRETCLDFVEFLSMIKKKNREINLISNKDILNNNVMNRHIIDSAQIIDFVDLKCNTTYDLGSGGGFPGIIIAIIAKNMKKNVKINLCEKAYHKAAFLKNVSRELNLNTEIFQKDILEIKKIKTGTIMARAFKPLTETLDIVCNNFEEYKNLIVFMGKSGEKLLKENLKKWDLKFEKKKSITSQDSFLLNITNIKKKI
tara:strand:+ start:431 stop:1072 length:642 start_codon:yes stop_codon:yes gene_type:complete